MDKYAQKNEGMELLDLLETDDDFTPKDRIVGSFGIVGEDGYPLIIHWKESAYRKN